MEQRIQSIIEELDELTVSIKKTLYEYDEMLKSTKAQVEKAKESYAHDKAIKEIVEKMCELPDRNDLSEDMKNKLYTELELRYICELEKAKRKQSKGESIVMRNIERKIGWTW